MNQFLIKKTLFRNSAEQNNFRRPWFCRIERQSADKPLRRQRKEEQAISLKFHDFCVLVFGPIAQGQSAGVIIERSLSWEEHINVLHTKVARAIGFLKCARKFLPQNTLGKMYRGIGEPHFRYCCSVWECCGATKLLTLRKFQNRAARIVTKSKFDTPAMELICNLNWSTVSDIIRSETATTMYKSLNGLVSEYLSDLFVKNLTRNVRELRNTETDLLLLTTAKNKKWAERNIVSWT